MAEGTLIEWARHPVTGKGATWNIVTGCDIVSPGCTNCYAMKLAGTRLRNHPSREGLTRDSKAGPVWNGQVRFNEQWLAQPLRWTKPHGIFVAAHGDLFAEGVTDYQLDKIFATMALCPRHIFYVLTKRPARMRQYMRSTAARAFSIASAAAHAWGGKNPDGIYDDIVELMQHPLPNVWLGVSVEDQTRADERIPVLLDTPAAVRFISAEPLLGPIDLTMIPTGGRIGDAILCDDALRGPSDMQGGERLDWVIAGGESGPDARPSHPDWFRSLRDQCAAATRGGEGDTPEQGSGKGVPFFFKQWGAWTIASEENGHYDSAMASNDAIWLDIDGRRAKPSCKGMQQPIGMFMPGKKAAGRRLDGVEHTAWPVFEPVARSERKRSGEQISGSEGPDATLVEDEA